MMKANKIREAMEKLQIRIAKAKRDDLEQSQLYIEHMQNLLINYKKEYAKALKRELKEEAQNG